MQKRIIRWTLLVFLSVFCGFASGAVSAADNIAAEPAKREILLSLPGESWALGCDLADFKLEQMKTGKGGKERSLRAYNAKTGVMISIFLTKENQPGDNKKCREFYFDRLKADPPFKMDNITLREAGQFAIAEYIVKEHNKTPVNMQNLNAYLVHGDTWIDIHLSKPLFKAEDQKLFDELLATVKFKENYEPTLNDNFLFGLDFFTMSDYDKAIVYLEKALTAEKTEKRLLGIDKYLWRTLVENLGLAYLVTGKTEQARTTFEYGIAEDPGYTPFYYGSAYVHAKLGDGDKTLANLKLAYQYKDSLNQYNRKLPDPRQYSGFKQFFANEAFAKEIEQTFK